MTYEVPEQLTESKERWFILFTNKSLIATLCSAAVGYLCYKGMQLLGFAVVGIIAFAIIVLITFLLFSFQIGNRNVLGGGGLYWYEYLLHKWLHKRRRAVYLSCVSTDEEDEE